MRAVRTAGSQARLAVAIGTNQQTIGKWLKKGRLPAEYVLPVERVTGIARHELRPDLYPPDERAA